MSLIVLLESTEGKLKKSAFETLTYAYKTAKDMQVNCIAITLENCEKESDHIAKYGIDKLININNSFEECDNGSIAGAISEVFEQENGKAVVLSNSNFGKSIGPRLAIKCNASFISNVTETPINNTVKKKSFSGKAFEVIENNNDKVILAISPNSFYSEQNPINSIDVIDFTSSQTTTNQVKSVNVEKSVGKVSLAEAEIVISAGRGLKGPENWNMVEELADLLDAGTACSKPVSDIGWRPHSEHVGQTGKAIAPNLYIAIGISGAIQHLAGVNSSKVIVAVNTDPEAPFFKAADYGIVGDAFEVVPRIIDSIKAFKESN